VTGERSLTGEPSATGAPSLPGDPPAGRRVLVLGGARSGKSAHAERMLTGHDAVEYVATGPPADAGDQEWDARVAAHRQRRPAGWRTTETLDLEQVLAVTGPAVPVLLECVSTWLARVMAGCGCWEGAPGAAAALAERTGRMVAAWQATRRQVVAVSNEVGSGVVPATLSGRLFRDELGSLNTRLAAGSDEVWLCTAGIPQRLR
jgi:adenosylcobinamide kinase/adenosylcobinamide-phosphate guanylyltransferase